MFRHRTQGLFKLVLPVVGIFCLLAGCVVTKGAFMGLKERLDSTEDVAVKTRKDVETIQTDAKGARDAIQKDQADIKADMIDLHSEIQELRGQVTSGSHSSSQETREREAMEQSVTMQLSHVLEQLESLDARIIRIEEFFGLKKAASPQKGKRKTVARKPDPAPPASAPGKKGKVGAGSGDERKKEKGLSREEAYEMAYRLYKSGRYENARTAFESFIKRHPGSSLAGNALFWIGQTYYNAGDYEKAILKYQAVHQKYPKGAKAPDALLKMGFSLEKMGEPEAAVAALKKLLKEYPGASQADLANRKIGQLTSSKMEPKKDRGNEAKEKPKEPAASKKPPEKEVGTKNPS